MKRILLVHPSRGRPQQLINAFENFIGMSTHGNPITYLVSIDNNDSTLHEYLGRVKQHCEALAASVGNVTFQIIHNDNNTPVQAVAWTYTPENLENHDIIALISDDFRMPQGWDLMIIDEFEKHGYDKIIKTHQPGGRPDLIAIQIAGSQFWKEYGSFFYHEYLSMYADDDMTAWAHLHGRVIEALHIVCLHMHPYIGLPGHLPDDETYARENNPMHHQVGREIFERRKANGFR